MAGRTPKPGASSAAPQPSAKKSKKGAHFLLTAASRNFAPEAVFAMTDREVFNLFVRMRWGGGGTQTCPECGTIDQHYFMPRQRRWKCKEFECRHSFSVTSGTIFADHKLPLRKLLLALALFAPASKGISAVQLSHKLKVSYMTAYSLMHKLREAIMRHQNDEPVSGLVHVDGAHFSGRLRKPRKKRKKSSTQLRSRQHSTAFPLHPNRRIVMAIRQCSQVPGQGGVRTIVEIVPAEDEMHCWALGQKYIAPLSVVMTDESPAYGRYPRLFDHRTVNHSTVFSTDEGVNNNQAESFFTRCRRFVIGQIHRITPKYMRDYMSEMAWREDNRRVTDKDKVEQLLTLALGCRESGWWRRYWQGDHRAGEILFIPPP